MGDRRVLQSKELRRAIATERMRERKLEDIRQQRKAREKAMHEMLPVIRIEASQVQPVAYVPKERSIHAYVPRRSLSKRAPYNRWGRR
jgi:hypothetical protein